jgi:hypothetical protein
MKLTNQEEDQHGWSNHPCQLQLTRLQCSGREETK